ncbi:hypothetical protein A2Z22_05160 [Candidatus Woesebacteria bacterium RBG_16_34_12]|uniref:Uncharacterized protein n=1 Tax=Candidatus Woesebacteria bacterium RBG_16_34_12 TaxID=1802480 RepID=A0A1F7XAA2_9BACT|nr:MAG: hypothetical protein A2Z22_05160 [Candidatus Woesebacteria bacterium RBG_16_34_12]
MEQIITGIRRVVAVYILEDVVRQPVGVVLIIIGIRQAVHVCMMGLVLCHLVVVVIMLFLIILPVSV